MRWSVHSVRAVFLTTLLLLVLLPTSTGQASPSENHEQHRYTIALIPDEPSSIAVDAESNTSALLSWTCSSCSATVDDAEAHITTSEHGAFMVSVHIQQEESVVVSFTSSIAETLTLMVLKNIDDEHQHALRPSPETDAISAPLTVCALPTDCVNASLGHLASTDTSADDAAVVHTGDVEVAEDEYMVFNASKGDTLEWQWLASTHTTNLQVYHQTDQAEVLLSGGFSSGDAFSRLHQETPTSEYWTAPDDGRFVARISTDDARALWAAHVFLHPYRPVESLVGFDLTQPASLVGHGNTTSPFDWSQMEVMKVRATTSAIEISVDQLLNGVWVEGPKSVLQPDEVLAVYPYPDVNVGRIHMLNAPVFAVEVYTERFGDNNGSDAPSYLPPNLEAENTSWPIVNLSEATQGELTLAVHDTTDTYRIVVDGWEDSIHFVQFVVDGQIEGLELQLWDIDQTTSETLATDITQPVGDQLKIGLQVGRGTHYLQLRFQNTSDATPHLWGEDVPSRPYVIQPSYSLIDEGEEPWFPPSDDAVYWGNIARWFMGILFLVPVLYLAIHVQRSKTYAASVAEKKQRLAWYTSRLDSGESNVKQARTDMAKALHAVAQLEWQDGLEAWGPKRIEHRTEDVALAVWSVDERLAKQEGAWPVVVGVHVINGTWDLAALRFDAPEGEGYEVVNVEPRFLFQGEEVFLDTMGPGHRTYLVVELSGTAPHVDLELNGRMDGAPFAARIPESLLRQGLNS